jgi:hypothetical protein
MTWGSVLAGTRDYPMFQIFQTISWAHPAQFSMGTACFFSLWVKQREHKINHLSLSVANVWKEWSCTSIQPVCFRGTSGTPLFFTNILETPTVSIFRVFMLYNFVGMYRHMHTSSGSRHRVLPMFWRFLPIVLLICTSQWTVILKNKLLILCNAGARGDAVG